ncbi:MAG: AsmA family protein [Elusimicrobiota bacterium]|jgi:hypothetical protein|nr:AsmA family protein [Elusimicrobiota bacterium]
MKRPRLRAIKKAALYAAGFVFALLFAAQLSLRFLLPLESVKNRAEDFVSRAMGAQMRVEGLRAGLLGLYLQGVSLDIENKPFASARQVNVRFSLLRLLKGELKLKDIRIDGFTLQIARLPGGVFNIEAFFATSVIVPFNDIVIRQMQVRNALVTFYDSQTGRCARLEDVSVEMDDFSFKKPFGLAANAVLNARCGADTEKLPLAFTLRPDLKNLDFDAAQAELVLFAARLKGASLQARGVLANFNKPEIKLNLSLNNLSDALLKPLAPAAPAFLVPLVNINAAATFDYQNSAAQLHDLSLAFLNSRIKAGGAISYAKKLKYNFKAQADIALEGPGGALALAKNYKLKGAAALQTEFTEKTLKASVKVRDAGATLPQGVLEKLNINIDVINLRDIKMPLFAGVLNGHDFSGAAAYLVQNNKPLLSLNFKADTLLAKTPVAAAAAPARADVILDAPAASKTPKRVENWPLAPARVTLEAEIKKLDIPYIAAGHLSFKADMDNVTPLLDKAQGRLELSAGAGVIKDLYRLTNANAVTKVLFVSLGVVSRVVNTLNVLGVLNNLIAGGRNVDKSGRQTAQEKMQGHMDFNSFTSDITFENGVSTINDGYFRSDKLSFALKGDIDFNSGKLDMSVHAAPGNVTQRGMMPLTIAVGGTLDDPRGSMNILANAASLVRETLLHNPAVNILRSAGSAVTGGGKEKSPAPARERPQEGRPAQGGAM